MSDPTNNWWDPDGTWANLGSGATTSAPTVPASGTPNDSGFFQGLAALGTGYLSKRLDVDLMGRIQGQMPYPGQSGVGLPIYYTGTGAPRTGAAVPPQPQSWLNLSAMLPFVAVGAVVFFLTRKKG